jgi:DNA-binding IclR family transcriptional regulator
MAQRMWLEPEHLRLLARCRQPITVADLASDMDLPLGVVRVLLGDLRDRGLARVSSPAPSEYARDEAVLRMVLDELNSL